MSTEQVWTWEELATTWEHIREDMCRWDQQRSMTKVYLEKIPPKWRPGIALALALEKWKPGAKGRGCGTCALCVLYRVMNHPEDVGEEKHCRECPLAAKDRFCTRAGSLFREYHHEAAEIALGGLDGKKAVKIADKLYNLLVECYREEYER